MSDYRNQRRIEKLESRVEDLHNKLWALAQMIEKHVIGTVLPGHSYGLWSINGFKPPEGK